MKLSKNKLKEILKEEIGLYIKSVHNERINSKLEEIISESKEPNYSPKLGFTLKQFMEELGNKQLTNVEFVKEDGGQMVFSTLTKPENVIIKSLNDDNNFPTSRALDDGTGKTLLYFEKEEGVDTSGVG